MKKVGLLIPYNFPVFEKSFIFSLLNVITHFHEFNQRTENRYSLSIWIENAGWIDTMREHLAETALKEGIDILAWLDGDMVVPPGMLERMILTFERNEKIDAITGLYTWKKPPYLPHVYYRFNKRTKKFDMGAGFSLSKPFPVEGAGFGCVAIRRKVFEQIERPWFKMDWGEYGEDLYFFAKAQPIKMICDPVISCQQIKNRGIGIEDFLKYNKLKVNKDKVIQITQKRAKEIGDEHAGKGGVDK